MAACRACRSELEARVIGCPRCSPAVSPAAFDAIEQDPRWRDAQHHRVRSRRGTGGLLAGGVLVLLLVLLWPSYSEAVDGGDASGRPLVIALGVLAGLFVAGGAALLLAPLRRHACVVLTTTWLTTRDGRRRTSTSYAVHLATRARLRSLPIGDKHLAALPIGEAVIVFERWGFIDDIWRVPLSAAVPATPIPVAPMPPPVAVAQPVATPAPVVQPAAAPTVVLAEAAAAAVTSLGQVDPAVVARAQAAPFTRPARAYASALAWVGIAAFILGAVALASDSGPGPDDDLEAYQLRSEIIWTGSKVMIGAALVVALWLVFRTWRRPLARTLAVVIDRRTMRVGSTLHTSLELVTPDGARSTWSAANNVVAPLHVPVIAYCDGRQVLAVRDVGAVPPPPS